jgi:hypothetical protein
MSRNSILFEKRNFGRRNFICHAFVRVGRQQPRPCLLRNISQTGALVEFDGTPPGSNVFDLIVAEPRFEARCEVKHRRGSALGVYFSEGVAEIEERTSPSGKELFFRFRAALARAS